MSATLTKPLVVPEFASGLIKLYTPSPSTGAATVNPAYTVDVTNQVLAGLFPGQGRLGAPNVCKLRGVDLFFTNSSANSQAVIKLPGYLQNPAASIANAFVITLDGGDYVGLAVDKAGNLYTAEGPGYGNNAIVSYGGAGAAAPVSGVASGDNYTSRTVIGNAGMTAYFGDLVFDSAGNLWAADYWNHRVVAFDAAGLGGANSWHAIGNPGVPLAVANSVPGLSGTTANLFAEPEGVDFDGFGPTANLWVGNNNDGGAPDGRANALTSLVEITAPLQQLILATASGAMLPAASIVANTNCFIYQVPNNAGGARPQFGGLQIDKAADFLYVNEEIGGNGRAYDLRSIAATPNNPAASLLAIASTNPGNGGIAMLQLGAYIADTTADMGLEPDTTTTRPWESLAISVVQTSLGPQATLPPNVDVAGGMPCAIYVQVENFAPTPTLGIETLDLYWGKASAGLAWPVPWDGSVFDAPPFQASPLGGGIASSGMTVPVIPGFGTAVLGPFAWTAPDPTHYTAADGHFCLLARIVTPGLGAFGMSFPEGSALLTNVLKNARIAWRNIHIDSPGIAPMHLGPHVVVANYGAAAAHLRVVFEVLDHTGRIVRAPTGHVAISAAAHVHETLGRGSLGRMRRESERTVMLHDLAGGIDGVHLRAGETLTFAAKYIPSAPHHDREHAGYALRVSQYASHAGGERLVGGQTFVTGWVEGFGLALPHRR